MADNQVSLGSSNRGQIQHHKITLPKGGGAIQGIGEKFQANAVTGTGTFSVPIPVTPSRDGFQPSLSLTYDSGSGNGVFGLGWSLDVPSISRKTAQRLPEYWEGLDGDTFLLSGAEDLVPILTADGSAVAVETKAEGSCEYLVMCYRPRIEGLYARIEKWQQVGGTSANDVHWRSTTKDNVTSYYGRSIASRIADPLNPSRVFSWLLEESRDAKGNVVRYEYLAENQTNVIMSQAELTRKENRLVGANRHLKRISYGRKLRSSGGPAFHYHIVLDYGDHKTDDVSKAPKFATELDWQARVDPFSDRRSGFEVRTYRLCRRIHVFHEFPELDASAPVPVRSLELTYDHNPYATKLTSIQQCGYKNLPDGTFESKTLPPVTYSYSRSKISSEVKGLDEISLMNLPQGLSGRNQWMDLHGEGLSGVLTQQGEAWYYKRNEGRGQFGPMTTLLEKPIAPQLGDKAQLVDMDGDGNTELVVNAPHMCGFYTFVDGKWESFQTFQKRLTIGVNSRWLRQIDLTGDGRPDVLLADDNVFTWHECLGREGYAPAKRIVHPLDENKGPRLVFSEAVQTIFLADMTGDGLTDIVRIRPYDICYWPNLGHGRFGPKVVMDFAPMMAPVGLFNPRYVKLADADGSGTADLFYFGSMQPKVWFNRAGNAYDRGRELSPLLVDGLSNIDVIDLLGKGTSCVVWSSQLPGTRLQQMRYIDLAEEGKLHLLTSIDNGMGKVVNLTYAPSTEDYLRDRHAGNPWITKLPFPVHVLRSVETLDQVSGTKHHTVYRYHHGYFDGTEREFRGFGMVETLDTESFEFYKGDVQGEHYVKPVLTRTWFHNGAFLKQSTISKRYAEKYFKGVDSDNPDVLPNTVIENESKLNTEERREAHRALKGHMLRQEVWEVDPVAGRLTGRPGKDPAPYSVIESNFTVQRVQPKGDQKHAVFRVDPLETITWHYEQNAEDPRIAHDLTLEVGLYGEVKKSCALVYPRRGSGHPADQTQLHATCAVNEFIDKDPSNGDAFYLVGAPREVHSFEIGGLGTPEFGPYFTFAEVKTAVQNALASVIPFEQQFSGGPQARRLSWQRFLYWNDAQDAALDVGQITERALLHHVEMAVLTQGLVTQAFGSSVSDTNLGDAGYRRLTVLEDPQQHWWNPGLIQHYTSGGFYLPKRTEDPFGNSVTVMYDSYAIAPISVVDALGNTSTAEIDYRTLAPWKLTGPNQNVAEAVTDPLGMVIATSVHGEELGEGKGDLPLSNYLVQADASIANVLADPYKYLQSATTFFFYDLDVTPVRAVGLTRETHIRDLRSSETSVVQISLTYSDGFGRELQSKLKAEPGLAWVKQSDGTFIEQMSDPRWLVSGRTVYNNKQKPVKQYEPFYSATVEYEPEEFFATYGVTPVIHYDPLLRVIRTDIPKLQRDEIIGTETVRKTYHFFSNVEFTPWEVVTSDANDTVLDSEYHALYETLSANEKAALDKAAAHANTPSTAHLDTLARQFRTVQKLDATTELVTTTTFDITGKPLSVTDPRGNVAFRYVYDMAGAALRTQSIDAGDDRVLANVMGNPVLSFDARGHKISAKYDALHRLVEKRVTGNGLDHTVERLEYGEGASDAIARNLRGQLYRHFEQSGLATTSLYDITEKPRQSEKKIRAEYKAEANWPESETERVKLLEDETFYAESVYDALGRVRLQTNPDTSVVRPEFHQSGRLNKLHVKLNGEEIETEFVSGITYNPKGQRESIFYGNGTATAYGYERETFRLTSLVTTRASDNKTLQEISYVYDPVGNIVKIRDDSHNRVFTSGGPVEPEMAFAYDALYRLTAATGRTHNALGGHEDRDPTAFKQSQWTKLDDLGQLSNYTEKFSYDLAGSLTKLEHQGKNSFARDIVIHNTSNRGLLKTESFDPSPDADWVSANYFDANGNQTKFDHLAGVSWNYRDNLASTTLISRSTDNNDTEYYVYDSSGQRARKVKETFENGESVKRVAEKIYLGGIEIKRVKTVDMSTSAETCILDRSDLHVMDDKQRIAIVPRWKKDDLLNEIEDRTWLDTNRVRYQFGNHLGSASLELDGTGQIISYEEYFPYGGTAFIAGSSQAEVKLKEYRYTGKERDDSTGFYYYGGRYYAPWLGRWLSADPAGPVDGVNLYVYVSGNPVVNIDPDGKDWLKYTGQEVKWYGGKIGDTSDLKETYKGTSGGLGHQQAREQTNTEKGPIPEGKYSINLKPDPQRVAPVSRSGEITTAKDARGRILGGIEKIPRFGRSSTGQEYEYPGWGQSRARLEPLLGTETYERKNFYLHDSTKGFSHGCIETESRLLSDLKRFRSENPELARIDVVVEYSSPSASTYGGTDPSRPIEARPTIETTGCGSCTTGAITPNSTPNLLRILVGFFASGAERD